MSSETLTLPREGALYQAGSSEPADSHPLLLNWERQSPSHQNGMAVSRGVFHPGVTTE